MNKPDTSFLRKVSGVVHVGANSGQERDTYRDLGLRVVWVEPIAEVFDELSRNISGYPNQRAIRALVTDEDGKDYQFNVSNNSALSSSILQFGQHRDIWPEVDYVSSRTLQSTTLEALFNREKLTPEMYPALVMDVQGAELLVLKGAGRMLGQFQFVKAEAADFESYIGCAVLSDLDEHLKQFGFEEIARQSFAKREAGGTYWDVTWERKKVTYNEMCVLRTVAISAGGDGPLPKAYFDNFKYQRQMMESLKAAGLIESTGASGGLLQLTPEGRIRLNTACEEAILRAGRH